MLWHVVCPWVSLSLLTTTLAAWSVVSIDLLKYIKRSMVVSDTSVYERLVSCLVSRLYVTLRYVVYVTSQLLLTWRILPLSPVVIVSVVESSCSSLSQYVQWLEWSVRAFVHASHWWLCNWTLHRHRDSTSRTGAVWRMCSSFGIINFRVKLNIATDIQSMCGNCS